MSRKVRAYILLMPMCLLLLASCSTSNIHFIYPDETADMSLRIARMPMFYIDAVRDLRPIEQREGQGKVWGITYPGDDAWSRPATLIYADALAQDLEQTHLVELVPLQAQAEFIMTVDLLSMSNRLERKASGLLFSAGVGIALGMLLGDDASHRAKLAVGLGILSALAIPVKTHHRAEAEVRLKVRNRQGETIWEETCKGEVEDQTYMPFTARSDQKLVDEYLTRAVKRANGCLLQRLRPFLIEQASD